MELQSKDTALLFKITHSKPIEMSDFVATISSLSTLFENFVKDNADSSDGRKAKLYVEKIEHGCIEFYLIETITAISIPFIENFNLVYEFAGHLANLVKNAIYGKNETKLTIPELKALRDVFSINAGDHNGKTEFGAIDRDYPGAIFNKCTFNFMDSNAAQNQIKRAIEEKENELPDETIHKKQLMTIFQMRGDMSTNAGNKATIDTLANKPLSVVFDTDDLKMQILKNDENPTKKAFLVDVVVMTSNSKKVAYKVVALHEIIPLD